MDAGTPNPNKPRLSRRLLSHFTLTLSVLLALSFIALAVVGPTTQDVEAILSHDDYIVIGATTLGNAIWSFINGWLNDNNNDALDSEAPGVYARFLANGLKNTLSLTKDTTQTFANSQELQSYYYIRKAQWMARELYLQQEALQTAHVWDPYYVMTHAGENSSSLMHDFNEYMLYALDQHNEIIDLYQNIGGNFTGAYANVGWGIWWNGVNFVSTSGAQSISMEILTRVTGTGTYYYDGVSPLYFYQNGWSGTSSTIRNASTNAVIKTVSLSANSYADKLIKYNLTDYFPTLSPGVYQFEGNFFGKLLPVAINSNTNVTVGIHFPGTGYDEKHIYGSWTSYADSIYKTYNTGAALPSPPLIGAYAEASHKSNANFTHDLTPNLRAIKELNNAIIVQQKNALAFAQSYYNAIVASGDPGSDFGLPLMLIPDPSQLEGMTWEQIYMLYVAYLQTAYVYYQEHGGALGDANVTVSGESIRLRIRGSIVNETGATICDNSTIYTPFVTTSGIVLRLGVNIWPSAGYAIRWGSAESIANMTNSTAASLIDLQANYRLYIQEMMYDNASVSEITLTPTSVRVAMSGNLSPPPGPPKVLTDLEWLLSRWYYFAIVAGIICLLAAISLRNVAIIAVGLILLAAGGIGYWMAGDFSLLDWLSMEPSNLRAWLQQLR